MPQEEVNIADDGPAPSMLLMAAEERGASLVPQSTKNSAILADSKRHRVETDDSSDAAAEHVGSDRAQ